MDRSLSRRLARATLAALLALIPLAARADDPPATAKPPAPAKAAPPAKSAHARPQHGKASYYAPKFNGRKMANGKPFKPDSHTAASKTLPLGTVAEVTNLNTGQSTTVNVEDRGPFVPGRVIDVAPKAAEELGMKHDGTAPVVVKPIAVPPEPGAPPAPVAPPTDETTLR